MTKIDIGKEDNGRRDRYVARVPGIDAEAELTFTHAGPGSEMKSKDVRTLITI